MCSLRPFRVTDIFKFNRVNLDPLTETYDTRFYFDYLSRWPEYFTVAVHPNSNRIMGYVMGKSEGRKDNWHGHVTAVTVAPTCRKLGLANQLMKDLERISDERDCRFVDLFVRKSNKQAVSFYTKLDYYVHEQKRDYYQSLDNPSDTEDAFDMHKILHGWTKLGEFATKKSPTKSKSPASEKKSREKLTKESHESHEPNKPYIISKLPSNSEMSEISTDTLISHVKSQIAALEKQHQASEALKIKNSSSQAKNAPNSVKTKQIENVNLDYESLNDLLNKLGGPLIPDSGDAQVSATSKTGGSPKSGRKKKKRKK